MNMKAPLLNGEGEGAVTLNDKGRSPFFLVCEHAGKVIPKSLGDLGLKQSDLLRHIAWDIGAEPVARHLSQLLDAPLVMQRYSRLVYDCNRPPDAPSAIPEVSETTPIPGNERLSPEEKAERAQAIYFPFHAQVSSMLEHRLRLGQKVIFVTVHSFTPVFKGVERRLEVGLLHDRDRRFSDVLLALMRRQGIDVRANEPYGPQDGVCHTLNLHAGARDLPYAMIEIRNDLIEGETQQKEWAERLSDFLQMGADQMGLNKEETVLRAGE